MFSPRFSLKSLFGLVAFVALALALLLQPWQSSFHALVLTALLLIMLLSIPASIYARKRTQAFCVGFTIVGWGYFFLTYTPGFDNSIGQQMMARPIAEAACLAVTNSLGDLPRFLNVIHALLMFVFAYLGGLASVRFYENSRETSSVDERLRGDLADSYQDPLFQSKEFSLRGTQ